MAQISTRTDDALLTQNSNAVVRFFRQWDIQLMVWPALILVFIFSYVPMYGIITAFKEYNVLVGMNASPWVGLQHFRDFFNSPDFNRIMRNTVVISSLKLLIGFPAPILLALMLNEVKNRYFKNVVQSITYLPFFISWVIVTGLVISMLSVDNGSVNIALERVGAIDGPVNWLSIKEYFWAILITTNVWKDIGFNSIVFIAAIAGVDPHLYEAAEMDGAGRIKRIFLITLPGIMPVVVIFLILAIGNLLNAGFEDILLLSKNPILWKVSDVIDTYVYRNGIENMRYSFATAIGLFKAVINVVLLVLANRLARRWGSSLW